MDLAEKLLSLPKYGNGIGLHRMTRAIERLRAGAGRRGFFDTLDAVKITGSNGKGTTATLVAALFAELGLVAGLYTSPHLRRASERVRLLGIGRGGVGRGGVGRGAEVGEEELHDAFRRAEKIAGEISGEMDGERFGAFELLTVAALDIFSGRASTGDALDTVVAEAGIGGRYDSTRAIPGHVVGLTSLDLEHAELLGPSLEMIAYDKADLCPDGGTLIVGAGLDEDLRRRLRGYARVRGIEMAAIDEAARLTRCRFDAAGMHFDMELLGGEERGESIRDVTMAMAGRHQWSNAVLALLLAEAWTRRHRPEIAPAELRAAWRRALSTTVLPGRFEKVAEEPATYIDFCHTPRAAARLAETAREALAEGILLVLGVSEDKDHAALAPPLLAVADAVVLTRARHRGLDPRRLEELVADCESWRLDELSEALAFARREAGERGLAVLVAGGLFLGVEASEVLAGRDPSALRFL